MWLLAVSALVLFITVPVQGHGRLYDPPARGTCWRFGITGCEPHYNDNELFCGGKSHQWEKNGGKCGVCGDAWDLPQPRDSEAGGRYGKGVIVKTYTAGSIFNISVQITAAHLGWFEFRLCKNDNVNKIITHKCLDENLLLLADGSTRYKMPPYGTGMHTIPARLPRGLTCSQCVLQWKYHTGNLWGCDNDNCCIGCGKEQEEFYGCADIAIK